MVKRILIVLLFGTVLMALMPAPAMAQEDRDPLLYGLASFILPGFGQYLNEEPGKALTHFLVAAAIPIACYTVTHYTMPYWYPRYALCGLASLGWAAMSAIDAYETAKRFNEEHGFALDPSRWEWASGKIGLNSQ